MSEEQQDPEPIDDFDYEILPKNDGYIHFGYDIGTGDFEVIFDTFDLVDENADTLALILMLLSKGKMNTYIGEAMGIWSKEDDKKFEFVRKVLEKIEYYDLLLSEKSEKPIVKPSQIFHMDK